MRNLIKNNSQLWTILKGMIPVLILSNMATMLGSFVDGIVVGSGLGDQAMSAMGLCIPVTYLGTALSGIFSTGTQNLCASAVGHGDKEEATRYFNTSMGFLFLFSAVLTALILIFADPLAVLLGARGAHSNLKPDLFLYLHGIGLAIPFICLTNTLSSLLYIEGKKRTALTAITVGTAVNVAGDLAAAYVFDGGMLGIGLATAFCYIVSSAILLAQFAGKRGKHSAMCLRPSAFSPKSFIKIFRVGSSMAVVRICHMLRTWIINTILATLFTQAAITAFSVQNSLASLVTCVSVGAGAAALTVGSIFAGEKNLSGLKTLMKMTVLWGVTLSVIVAVGCILARNPIVGIFSDTDEVMRLAGNAFLGYLVSLPFYSVNMVFMMFFQGIRRLKTAIILCIFDNLLFVCLAALILGNVCGVNGVWAAFPVGEVCTLVVLTVMAGIYHKRPVRQYDDLLQLREVPDAREQLYSCRSLEEIMDASEQAGAFARQEGADKKTAVAISLCIEEYGKNVMEWAFRESGQPFLSVRLMKDEGSWKIYLKDMGKRFDPLAWLKENADAPKVAEEHIGIRLTAGMASDLKYVQALGMNTVIITI